MSPSGTISLQGKIELLSQWTQCDTKVLQYCTQQRSTKKLELKTCFVTFDQNRENCNSKKFVSPSNVEEGNINSGGQYSLSLIKSKYPVSLPLHCIFCLHYLILLQPALPQSHLLSLKKYLENIRKKEQRTNKYLPFQFVL